jgi:hypothetical protein
MPLFKKKADPITDRARVLSAEIAALESQIRKLDTQLQGRPAKAAELPPSGEAEAGAGVTSSAAAVHEPIFEQVDQNRLQARGETAVAPEHFNELGVRKYDLPALMHRIRNHFRGPSASNPKLINYLAAGGIQGLRPLRYEKRIARNRFVFFTCALFAVLFGILWWAARNYR